MHAPGPSSDSSTSRLRRSDRQLGALFSWANRERARDDESPERSGRDQAANASASPVHAHKPVRAVRVFDAAPRPTDFPAAFKEAATIAREYTADERAAATWEQTAEMAQVAGAPREVSGGKRRRPSQGEAET